MAPIDKKAETAAIEALNKQWGDAATAHDLDAVVAFYAPDGSLVWPGEVAHHGTAAITAAWKGMFSSLAGLALHFTSERIVISDAGDLASDFGKVAMGYDADTGRVEAVAKYLVVWRKEGGTWKVLYDAYNMNSADG